MKQAKAILISVLILLTCALSSKAQQTITVPAGGNLQAAHDQAQCGDTIISDPGTPYILNLRLRKNCPASNRIKWTTRGFSVPAGRRVTPADSSSMTKVLTPGNGIAVLEADAKAGGYEIIGIQFGVNYGSDPARQYHSSFLINLSNGDESNPAYGEWLAHDITLDRCYLPGKFGDVRFGAVFNGINLSLINSRIDEFANPQGNDSLGVWLGTGPGPYLIENNFISAGMWQIFTGGADGDSPNFGTVAAGSTATRVNLSGMNGVAPVVGDLISLRVHNPPNPLPTWRANSGYSVGETFYIHTPWTTANNKPPIMFYVAKSGTSGGSQPDWFNAPENRPLVDGTVEWHFEVTGFQIGRVKAISGSVVDLEAAMPQGLVLPPVVGTKAKWNGNQPSDVTIRRNHFFRPGSWAAAGAPNKGMFQFKAARRVLIEGNYFESEVQYPGLLGLSAGNQGGSAPWSTVSDITFINNRVRHLGTITNITLNDTFGKTATQGSNIEFSNNLLTEMGGIAEDEISGFLLLSSANGVRATHNTIVNNGKLLVAYGSTQTGFMLRDSVLTYNNHMNCEQGEPHFTKCFPDGVVQNNAVVNVPLDRRSEFPAGTLFATTHATVGYVNLNGSLLTDWALRADSPYKGKASDGKDIGVDITQLEAALSGSGSPPAPTPTVSPSPVPTPSPTPSVTPLPSPIGARRVEGYLKLGEEYFQPPALVTVNHPNSGPQTYETAPGGYFTFDAVAKGSVLSAVGSGFTFEPVTVDDAPYFILHGKATTPGPTPTPFPTPTPMPTPQPSPGLSRIAISSDGNEHDCDDITSTAMSIALLAKFGNASRLVYYGHSDHVWGSNTTPCALGIDREEAMRISAEETARMWGGFNMNVFINARAQTDNAVQALTTQIDNSLNTSPLTIIAAGPMEVIGRALTASGVNKQFVTVVSHSEWNDNHADTPEGEPSHSGWTWTEMQGAFPSVRFTHLTDQNPGLQVNESNYHWLRDSGDTKLVWLWDRHKASGLSVFDPSDAGMVYWVITGDENATPAKLRNVLEVTPAPTPSPVPLPTPTPLPSPTPTPLPTPEPVQCRISAPTSISVLRNSSTTINVTITNLTGATEVKVIGSNGQVTVTPLLWPVGPTSTTRQFSVRVKRNSRVITFQSSCGAVSVRVNVT